MDLNAANFEAMVLNAGGPVLVDFWAPWCGYCRRLSPVVDRLAAELGGKVTVAKLNIDEAAQLAERYKVDTIPSLILFQGGAAVSSVVNPASQDAIEGWLKEHGAI